MASLLDIRVPSKWYRRIIGAIEVICGGLMAGFPSRKLSTLYCTFLSQLSDSLENAHLLLYYKTNKMLAH